MFKASPRPWRAAAAPAIAALFLALWAAPRAPALTLNPIGNFEAPTYVTSEPNDPDRLLVTERLGKIELVDHGKVSTFADLTSLVGCQPSGCEGERGLMSLAAASGLREQRPRLRRLHQRTDRRDPRRRADRRRGIRRRSRRCARC